MAASWTLHGAEDSKDVGCAIPMASLEDEVAAAVSSAEEGVDVSQLVREELRRLCESPTESCAVAIVDRVARELDTRHRYVQSHERVPKWHIASSMAADTPPAQWRTRCGWAFGASGRYSLAMAAPPSNAVTCKKCFMEE